MTSGLLLSLRRDCHIRGLFTDESGKRYSLCAKMGASPLYLRLASALRHVMYNIVKPRGIVEVGPETPLPMLQRVIDIPSSKLGSEYTCSVFKTGDGKVVGPFTARRTLR